MVAKGLVGAVLAAFVLCASALRADERDYARERNPEIAQVLQLSKQQEIKLIDVLSEWLALQQERFNQAGRRQSGQVEPFERLKQDAEEDNRYLSQIKALLGAEKFERYLTYRDTAAARMETLRFNSRLGAKDKLRLDQKERMIQVIADASQKYDPVNAGLSEWRARLPRGGSMTAAPSLDSQKNGIRLNEASAEEWRRMNREIQSRLTQILTVPQLETYAQIEAEMERSSEAHRQEALVKAGLRPDFSFTADEPPVVRKLIEGPIVLRIKLGVNRAEPLVREFHGLNGQAVSFQAAEGLWVEVTPALYDDKQLYVDCLFFEQNAKGQRMPLARPLTDSSTVYDQSDVESKGGGTGTVMFRGKAYSLIIHSTARPEG